MKKKAKRLTNKKILSKVDPSSDPTSTFFLSFVGEYVEIICKGVNTTTEVGVFPVIVNGYLLDIDEKHLYLSDDGQSVSRAVKKEDYITIEIVQQMTEEEAVLHRVTIPKNKEEGN